MTIAHNNTLIFISHIHEEAELAAILKSHIREDFAQAAKVFVSSDMETMYAGDNWLNEVKAGLQDCEVMLVLCSEHSLTRPWINFEAGYAWVRGIPLIPVCHTDMTPSRLPKPYDDLLGIQASSENDIKKMYRRITKSLAENAPQLEGLLNCAIANVDYVGIAEKIRQFEKRYGYLGHVKKAVLALIKMIPDLEQILKPRPTRQDMIVAVFSYAMSDVRQLLTHLHNLNVLDFVQNPNRNILLNDPSGAQTIEIRIQVRDNYYSEAASYVMS